MLFFIKMKTVRRMIMKRTVLVLIFSALMSAMLYSQQYDDLQEKPITNERLKQFPSPVEGKNYFFLLSINDKTQIVIGDFSQVDKKIILINLKDDYTSIKSVVEFIPAKKQLLLRKESDSKFFTTDIPKLKRDIITGAIFKGTNSEPLYSYDDLEKEFKRSDASTILPETYGFSVKTSDKISNKLTAIFTFGKTIKGYYMQFKTFSYRENPVTENAPILKYSVYSKNTNDPVIKEYVDMLFKIRQPASGFVK